MQAQTQFSRTKRCVGQKKTNKKLEKPKTEKKQEKLRNKKQKKAKNKITRKTKNHSKALKFRRKISIQTLIFCFQLIFFSCWH